MKKVILHFRSFFPSLTIRFHTFLFAMIIIVSLSILNQDQIAMAQQQQTTTAAASITNQPNAFHSK